MAAYGNGSVFRRKDGRWVAKIIVDGKPRTRYAKSETGANKALRELWQDAAREERGVSPQQPLEPSQMPAETPKAEAVPTFAAFVEMWLASAVLKPHTVEFYRDRLAHAERIIGAKRLDE